MKPASLTQSLNDHGVPVLYASLAMAFALFAYWGHVRQDIYDVCADALRDESIREVGTLLDAVAPVTNRVTPAKSLSEDAPEGILANRVRLKFPSCLTMFVEFDTSTGVISDTRFYYFASEDVHPDSGQRPPGGDGAYQGFIIAYALAAIVLWYAFRRIKSRRIVSVTRWMIGVLLIPPGFLAVIGAFHFLSCHDLAN